MKYLYTGKQLFIYRNIITCIQVDVNKGVWLIMELRQRNPTVTNEQPNISIATSCEQVVVGAYVLYPDYITINKQVFVGAYVLYPDYITINKQVFVGAYVLYPDYITMNKQVFVGVYVLYPEYITMYYILNI